MILEPLGGPAGSPNPPKISKFSPKEWKIRGRPNEVARLGADLAPQSHPRRPQGSIFIDFEWFLVNLGTFFTGFWWFLTTFCIPFVIDFGVMFDWFLNRFSIQRAAPAPISVNVKANQRKYQTQNRAKLSAIQLEILRSTAIQPAPKTNALSVPTAVLTRSTRPPWTRKDVFFRCFCRYVFGHVLGLILGSILYPFWILFVPKASQKWMLNSTSKNVWNSMPK